MPILDIFVVKNSILPSVINGFTGGSCTIKNSLKLELWIKVKESCGKFGSVAVIVLIKMWFTYTVIDQIGFSTGGLFCVLKKALTKLILMRNINKLKKIILLDHFFITGLILREYLYILFLFTFDFFLPF